MIDKELLSQIAANYPGLSQVWQTSDGVVHLTAVSAQAQAAHLHDRKLTIIQLPKQK